MVPVVAALDRYDRRFGPLEGRSNVASADVDAVALEVNAVKQALPAFTRAVGSTISRLQGAGKWTAEFDTFTAAQLQTSGMSAGAVAAVQRAGGPRAILQRTAGLSTDLSGALDREVAGLRHKLSLTRWLEPVLGVPVQAGLLSTIKACYYRISYGIDCANGVLGSCLAAYVASRDCNILD